MATTIKDIAKQTGLGLATISSYINGGNVRQYNKVKIEKAIKELNFQVNETARGLKTNSTKTIGVVIPELSNLFFTQIISYAGDILRDSGYATIVCDCRTDEKKEKEVIEFLLKKRVDGLIVSPVSTSSDYLKEVAQKKPIVLLDRFLQGIMCSSVLIDNRDAIRQAVALLYQNGHRNIGFIGGPEKTFTVKERMQGYLEALREHEIPIKSNYITYTDYTIQGGALGANQLIQNNKDMTAIIASNFELTVGALISLKEYGLSVPDDISIVGFDNIEFAKAYNPSITIITQPIDMIGCKAARILLEMLKDKTTKKEINEILKASVFIGSSIKKIHQI